MKLHAEADLLLRRVAVGRNGMIEAEMMLRAARRRPERLAARATVGRAGLLGRSGEGLAPMISLVVRWTT